MNRLSPIRLNALVSGLALGLLASGTPGVARGAEPTPEPTVIRVSGEGRLTMQPDLAVLEIGVVTEADEAASASAGNAERADRILAALRKAVEGDPQGRVESVRYSLAPRHRYPKGGGSPEIAGYTARHTLRLRTGRLQAVGELIDRATAAGANQIERLEFELKDPQAAHARALAEATLDARTRAAAIASALDLRIVRIRSAESGSRTVLPQRRRAERVTALAQAATTPVEPGGVEILESVTLEVEVSD